MNVFINLGDLSSVSCIKLAKDLKGSSSLTSNMMKKYDKIIVIQKGRLPVGRNLKAAEPTF